MSQSSCAAAMLKDMIIQDTLCMTTSFTLFASILIWKGFISLFIIKKKKKNAGTIYDMMPTIPMIS
jgi:hypothetical protein